MQDGIEELDNQILLNRRKILEGNGKISHQDAIKKVEKEFKIYREGERKELQSDFDFDLDFTSCIILIKIAKFLLRIREVITLFNPLYVRMVKNMIKICKDNNKKLKTEIDDRISNYNREKCEWLRNRSKIISDEYEEKEINFLVYDNQKLIGGAIGFIKYDWYFLDILYIDENYRKRNIGYSLINELENFARKEKLIGIRTDTWDFQAKEFYEKMGFKLFGTLRDCPLGTINYFFEKKLKL